METKEIIIKAEMEDMGNISSVIQSKKGDFMSIDQEGNFLVVIAKIPSFELNSVRICLEELLGKDKFSMEVYKE